MTIIAPSTVTGSRGHQARTAVLLALSFLLGCSSAKENTSWKDEKAYGAKMARQGFWREAAFRFERAVEIKPDDAQLQNNLAVAYESIGETTKALTAYKRALELDPNNQKIKRNYARFAEYYTSVQRATAPAAAKPQ